MTLSDAQHELRQLGYGGSDIGAIVARNPWKGPHDVWLDKTGRGAPFESTQRSRNGHRFEAPAREWYVEEARPGAVIRRPGTIIHPTIEWWRGTPDGIVWLHEAAALSGAEPDMGMEIKTHTVHLRHLYGDPHTDQVPPWELLQCAWYMGATGLPSWDLVPLLDGEFTLYTIHRDLELEQILVDAVRHFHETYVLPDVAPPADGTDSYGAEILRRHPKHVDDVIVDALPEHLEVIDELREIRRALITAERREATLEQQIKDAIGDRSGIAFPEGKGKQKITWRKAADSARVDWEGLAEEALQSLQINTSAARAVLAQAVAIGALDGWQAGTLAHLLGRDPEVSKMRARRVSIVPGSRRFCVPRGWTKGEQS